MCVHSVCVCVYVYVCTCERDDGHWWYTVRAHTLVFPLALSNKNERSKINAAAYRPTMIK